MCPQKEDYSSHIVRPSDCLFVRPAYFCLLYISYTNEWILKLPSRYVLLDKTMCLAQNQDP